MGASARIIRHPSSVFGGELAAILLGLRCCLLKSISLAHIFSDSQSAVDGVSCDLEDYGPNDIFIRDIRGNL